jgi:DNA (cytosine-5)-methyltransferase 1
MKYLSLFSGIGGFELGIQQANMCQPKCVGYSEIDKYAIQVYNKQFNHKNYGDITKINASTLPDFELLIGGFPCQSFSIAGKRGGFNDTRGTLFFDVARVLKEKQPRLCLLENVKGLLSHEQGATFRTIISTLDELGYDCQWQVLNSKNFGVPQNRERVFIVGHLRGTSRPEVFPIGGADREDTRNVGEDLSYTIDANYSKGTNTLEKGRRQLIKGDTAIRRLTPKECERLQGFPDDWTKEGMDGLISDTQRYKMCGNSVTVPVIKEIINKLINY